MNLWEMMQQGETNEKENLQISSETTPKSSRQPLWTIQGSQSETIRMLTEQRDRLLTEGRPEDQKLIAKLSSDVSMMKKKLLENLKQHQLAVAEMHEELSHQVKDNLWLAQNNRELRSRNGLMSLENETNLKRENESLKSQCSELEDLVDWGSVEIAEKAEADKEKAIADAKAELLKAKFGMEDAIEKATEEKEAWVRKAKSLRRLLILTWLLSLICSPVILTDLWDFWIIPVTWCFSIFSGMFQSPDISIGLCIMLAILMIAALVGVALLMIWFIKYYRKRWCKLSSRFLSVSFTILMTAGRTIRKYLPFNLIVMFLIAQAIYLCILLYLDGYYDARNRYSEWRDIQGYVKKQGSH